MYQGLRYGLGRLIWIDERINQSLEPCFTPSSSLIIVKPTVKAILTTIFILNLIIAKDFMKKDKSNEDKIKSIEKIWSKQLLATEMKIEENSAEPTSRVVKVKDHLFCPLTAPFFCTSKVQIFLDKFD